MTVFISPGPRQHFWFSTQSENAHAFSCALPIAKQLFGFDLTETYSTISFQYVKPS